MSLRDTLGSAGDTPGAFLRGASASIRLGDLLCGTTLDARLEDLAGRSILLATRDPLAAVAALIELDGVAHRIIICTPDLSSEHVPALIANGSVNAIVSDHDPSGTACERIPLRVGCGARVAPAKVALPDSCATEWVLLTSGTTGAPKMVLHSLESLTAPIRGQNLGSDVVWGTFYDIRRYGGLQIFLRAILGRVSFVLAGAAESPTAYLLRLAEHHATHVSGTPSHWRRALMSPAAHTIVPRNVRLSGEIADQAVLNTLNSFYPQARVTHAFASTEAGVGFEVNDSLEGFPAGIVGAHGEVEIRIVDGSLQLRSARTAAGYIGDGQPSLVDGFVDTGDMVERRGDRYYFLGRRSGVINIGGLKVYPEEVEAAINRHPAVRMSLVRSRRSPITGSLVAADVVLNGTPGEGGADDRVVDYRHEILAICRESLAAHKVPATIRFVPALDIAPAGKVARSHA